MGDVEGDVGDVEGDEDETRAEDEDEDDYYFNLLRNDLALSMARQALPSSAALIHIIVKDFGFVAFFVYLAEITSPPFRAFFMTFYSFNQVIIHGRLHDAVPRNRVNQMLRNSAMLTVVSFVLAIFIPETPFWLILKDDSEKAEEIFTWIRGGNSDATEFNQMLASSENIASKGIIAYLRSGTFFIGMIFSIFIVICSFNPTVLMEVVLYDFYLTHNEEML
ncbi:hypothetical protein V9T40_010790 [Parthenolecanium corni]|uniref:Uncharacterized protein n=1 Tax=Parthenolecanium corni TaxID=536013 RepID=A0AAN9XXY9_9HEMI